MTMLADRLRDIIRSAPRPAVHVVPVLSPPAAPPSSSANQALAPYRVLHRDIDVERTDACWTLDCRYHFNARHGRVHMRDVETIRDRALRTLLPSGTETRVLEPILFIDLETTGLSGGAGTHAFLVGVGRFDGTGFRIQQFLLPGFAAERQFLSRVAECLHEARTIVTFNGKCFDVPVMETRWMLHRMPLPIDDAGHLDVLHPARRLWKDRPEYSADRVDQIATCSLGALERDILGVRREEDVSGPEIPARYFQFIRTADPSPLPAVLEHNRLDVLSLALLTCRLVALIDTGAQAATSARECLALGRLFEDLRRPEDALSCYRRVIGELVQDADLPTCAEALARIARQLRRRRQHLDAASAWQQILTLEPGRPAVTREATTALAVYYEHRAKDLDAARAYALRALEREENTGRREAVRHRLARLDRKLAARQAATVPSASLLRE